MESPNEEQKKYSRRNILTGSAALLVGGAVGTALSAFGATDPKNSGKGALEAPPLPWKWVNLDPMEAGQRAYRNYFDGGCGHTTYFALLSMLREKVGYPWTTLPDRMMMHGAAGYAGHGTLCGALGGTSLIINLVAYKDAKDPMYTQLIDRLYYWYAKQEFPSVMFDDISSMPKQIKVKAKSPLCHTSVSSWTLAAGEQVTSKAKKERCAKVSGEVVYITVKALNDYFDGKWTPPVWEPSKEAAYCVTCHGPADMQHAKDGMNQQQGHMECKLCHGDHTKVTKK
jgi:hypothetical protein